MNEEKKSVSIPAVNVFIGAVVVIVGVGYVMYKKGRIDEHNKIDNLLKDHGELIDFLKAYEEE